MVLIKAKENSNWLIQVYQKGFDQPPTLKYTLKEYELKEGMLTVLDPRSELPKSFPSIICTVDGVKA